MCVCPCLPCGHDESSPPCKWKLFASPVTTDLILEKEISRCIYTVRLSGSQNAQDGQELLDITGSSHAQATQCLILPC